MKNTILLLSLITAIAFGVVTAQTPISSVKISTEEELKSDVALVPCNNKDRREGVKNLFKKMGAVEDDIKVEKLKDIENITLLKKGKTDETIIIGAHYDKVKDGCGAIDNWTGIVLIANIYRGMKELETDKTYLFVAFDQEEPGLLGSAAMVKAMPKEKRASYCSMVNLDSFGFNYPQVLDNASNPKMTEFAAGLAKELQMPFAHAALSNADADSTSFKEKDIPAITFHGLSNNWQNFLHSSNDKVENINMGSVYISYQFVLRYLTKIDKESCGVFRKQPKPEK